jgi:acetate kinase
MSASPSQRLLVLNAGSSSLKFGVFELPEGGADLALRCRGQIAGIGPAPQFTAADAAGKPVDVEPVIGPLPAIPTHSAALAVLLRWLEATGNGAALAGAGHRVVHGGTAFAAHCRLTTDIIEALADLEPLAPHHQPHNLAAIRALAQQRPGLPQAACFDTAFHATQPPEARRIGLPRAYADRGIQRYGFHGLSFEHVVQRLQQLGDGRLPERLIIAHLGNGASMCAVRAGRSIATTMGFSTLDGLIMGTRIGALDPGVILHLMREDGIKLKQVEDLLYNKSGLLGLSGHSADMKVLLASDDPRAAEAVDQFCYSVVRHLGSLAAALGGLDALVFTGGIGENAAAIRARVCEESAWLGLVFDPQANAAGGPMISHVKSPVAVWVVPTDEERIIARHTRRLLGL